MFSMRIHPDLKVLNTVHEANWEACKENCNNVNKQCRNFIYNVRSINFILTGNQRAAGGAVPWMRRAETRPMTGNAQLFYFDFILSTTGL